MKSVELEIESPVEKLKCELCKNYLSYFPVKISITNHQNICGRCLPLDGTTSILNEAYEIAVQCFKFPCRYKGEGCVEEMFPQMIPDHEESCTFKVVRCPIKNHTNCDWEGPRPDLGQHCEEQHIELFLKNGEFQIDLSKSFQRENFLKYDNVLFIITREFFAESNKLLFSIYHLEEAINTKNFPYEINFKSNQKSLHMDGCTTLFKEKEISTICLDSLKDGSDSSSVVFVKINVDKEVEHGLASSEKYLNDNMLSQLKCSSCDGYALPPIYFCENNGIICTECIENEIQYRKFRIQETRNFNLDGLASLVIYPCKYKKNGCDFVSKPEQLKIHQKFCFHRVFDCPVNEYVKCEWTGLGKDLWSHLQSDHSELVRTNSSKIIENVGNIASRTKTVTFTSSSSFPVSKCETTIVTSDTVVPSHVKTVMTVGDRRPIPTFGSNVLTSSNSKNEVGASTNTFAPSIPDFFDSLNTIKIKSEVNKFSFGVSSSPTCKPFKFNLPLSVKPITTITTTNPTSTNKTTEILSPFNPTNSIFNLNSTTPTTKVTPSPFSWSVSSASYTATSTKTTSAKMSTKLHSSFGYKSPQNIFIPRETLANDHFLKCYIIKYSNHLFRLSFSIMNKKYCWTMQMIGNIEENFKYMLQIIDESNDRSVTAKQTCCALTKKEKLFVKEECCFFLAADHIQHFLSSDNVLTFEAHIFK